MRRASFLFWLDLVLLLTFALLQEPETTGLWGHEWISIGLAVLLFFHLLVNWRWIVGALRRYTSNSRRHRINTWLNAALHVAMVFTIFSGIIVSRFVLPALGMVSSEVKMWKQLHSLVADGTLAILGLHVAINWDWIANVIRRWRRGASHPETVGGRSLWQRLGLGGIGSTTMRTAKLGAATALVCVLAYLPVAGLAREQDPKGAETRWLHPDWGDIPGEMTVQLLVIAGAAVVGRYVFKIKL